LTAPDVASKLIEAVQYYHEHKHWFCRLFLLMPDHLHAMISFPADVQMSRVISKWKSYTTRSLGVSWQENYFDHRLRSAHEADKTFVYILQNPVVKGLCSVNEHWPWQFRSNEMP